MTLATPTSIYSLEKFGAGQLTDTLNFANLTVTGTGVSISPDGYIANCLSLDRTGTFSISASGLSIASENFVVTGWINLPTATTTGCLLSIYAGPGGSPTNSLRLVPVTATTFDAYIHSSVFTSTPLTCGVWYFVGFRSTAAGKTYGSINGAAWTEVTNAGHATQDLFIGANHDITISDQGPLFERFNGFIDELRVYRTDVTSADLATAYANDLAAHVVIPATVTDGATVLAVDLNTLLNPSLADLQTASEELPTVYYHQLNFDRLDSTAEVTQDFVIVDDAFIDEVAISLGNHDGTVTVELSSGAMIEDISLSGTGTGSTYAKPTRYFADTSKPQQLLLKNSTLSVTASTTASANSSAVSIGIGMVTNRRRA